MALYKHLKYGLQCGVSVSHYICVAPDIEYHLEFLFKSINTLNPEQNYRYFRMEKMHGNVRIFIQIVLSFPRWSDWCLVRAGSGNDSRPPDDKSLNQWCYSSRMYICATSPWWVNQIVCGLGLDFGWRSKIHVDTVKTDVSLCGRQRHVLIFQAQPITKLVHWTQ